MADRKGVPSNLNNGLEDDLKSALKQEDIDALFDVLADWNHVLEHLPPDTAELSEPQP